MIFRLLCENNLARNLVLGSAKEATGSLGQAVRKERDERTENGISHILCINGIIYNIPCICIYVYIYIS